MSADDERTTDNEETIVPPPADLAAHTNGNGHQVVDRSGEQFGFAGQHDIDAERSIAGAMLIGGIETVDKLRTLGLEPHHVLDPTASTVIAACYELHEAGVPIDVLTVADELGDAVTNLTAPGSDGTISHGKPALIALTAACVSWGAAPSHARIVIEHARARALKYAVSDLTEGHRLDDGHRLDTALQRIIELRHATTTRPTSFPVHWVHETLDDPPPPVDDLVDGILARGEITGVGAPRNVGKSWFGMNLATLLSRGSGRFLGELEVRQRARTLICHGEMNRRGAASRWQHLNGAYVPDDGIAETFQQWRLRVVERRSTTLKAGGSQSDKWYDVLLDDGLEQTIADNDIDVLVIDPWAVYYAGAENSNDEVEAALNRLREIALGHDLAVLLFHHLRGGTDGDSPDPEDAWRGATRLPDAVDNRVTLLPHYTRKQAKDQGMTRKQARRYQDVYFLRRGAAAPDDIAIAWNPATGWWERWKTPQELGAELGGRPTHYNPIDVVDVLRDAGGTWTSIRKAADDLGLSPTSATKLLDRAVAAGHVEQFDAGRGHGFRLPGVADPTLEEATDGML